MPVDPQVQDFLDVQAKAAIKNQVPPIAEQTVEMAREGSLSLAAWLGQGADVEVTDRPIPGPIGDITLRIYQPRGGEDPYPVLVYYHGGGWVIGDLETHDHACRALCEGTGCVVVSVNYRLGPEHKFPAAVDDCWAALKWIAANAAELQGDASRLSVGGDSAGGNLAAVVSLLARDAGAPSLALQLLIYPAVDMRFGHPSIDENADGYVLTKDHMIWFREHYLSTEQDRSDFRASPLLAESHKDLPPALIITAEFDPLRDEGAAYKRSLAAAGVPVTLSNYDGQVHMFFQLSPILDGGRRAVDEACAALREAFGISP